MNPKIESSEDPNMTSPDAVGNIKNPLDSFIGETYKSKEGESSVVIRTDSDMRKI